MTIAGQQALIKVFRLSYRQAASIAHIHHWTLWMHVAAKPGSNVSAWEYRPESRRLSAVVEAESAIHRFWQAEIAKIA